MIVGNHQSREEATCLSHSVGEEALPLTPPIGMGGEFPRAEGATTLEELPRGKLPQG